MVEAPKTQKAIFDMAGRMFMDEMYILHEKCVTMTPQLVKLAAENCLADATIFMQTFKDLILAPADTKPV